MKILYFANFREKVNIAEETIKLPTEVKDIIGLIDWLSSKGENYALAFADIDHVRVAVNQEHVNFDARINDSDEIAFFPPMTGG